MVKPSEGEGACLSTKCLSKKLFVSDKFGMQICARVALLGSEVRCYMQRVLDAACSLLFHRESVELETENCHVLIRLFLAKPNREILQNVHGHLKLIHARGRRRLRCGEKGG